MSAGTSIALTSVRVARGAPRPGDDVLRQRLERDRAALGMAPMNGLLDLAVAGPYRIEVDGDLLDEYVVWER